MFVPSPRQANKTDVTDGELAIMFKGYLVKEEK